MSDATGFDGFVHLAGCRGKVVRHAEFAERHPDWPDYLETSDRERSERRVRPEQRGLLALSLASERYSLSRLLGVNLQEVIIRKSDAGVPYLEAAPGMTLSISRTFGASCVAINVDGKPIGADIERLFPIDYGPMLKMICSETEQAALVAMISGKEALLRFLRLWTLKEAALKAIGKGLRAGAKNVGVGPEALMESGPVGIRIHGRDHGACLMHDSEYVVAVVIGNAPDQDMATAIVSGAAS